MATAAFNKFACISGSLTMHNVLFVQYDSFVYIQKLKSKDQFPLEIFFPALETLFKTLQTKLQHKFNFYGLIRRWF